MTDTSYVIVGAGAIVDCEGSLSQLLQRGAAVPSNAKPEAIEHLLAVGLIAEGTPEGGLAPTGHLPTAAATSEPGDPAAGSSTSASYPLDGSETDQDAWIANAKVADVVSYVTEYPDTGASILAAEQRKGEKARSTLVEQLTKLTERS